MTKATRRKTGGFFLPNIFVRCLVTANRLDCPPCVRRNWASSPSGDGRWCQLRLLQSVGCTRFL